MVDFAQQASNALALAHAWQTATAALEGYNAITPRQAPASLAGSVLGDESGTGTWADRLKLAKDYLQYLDDIGQKESTQYAAQLAVVGELQKRSDAVTKAVRDATIEMTQSPEYKAASVEILRLQTAATDGKQTLTDEEAIAKSLSDRVSALNQTVTDAQTKMTAMSDAAGVTSAGGAGGRADSLTKQLAEAKDSLQYMVDKGTKDTQWTHPLADAQKSIADLTAKLADAQKELRITQYEFTHSPEYAAQQKAIKDAQDAVKAAQADDAAERKRLDAMKLEQTAREKALTDAEAARAQQIKDIETAADKSVAAMDEAAAKIPPMFDVVTKKIVDAVDSAGNAIAQKITSALGGGASGGGAAPGGSSFESDMAALRGMTFSQDVGIGGGVGFMRETFAISALLDHLAELIAQEDYFSANPIAAAAFAQSRVMIPGQIQQIVDTIRKFGGAAGKSFSLEAFKSYLAQQKSAGGGAVASVAAGAPSGSPAAQGSARGVLSVGGLGTGAYARRPPTVVLEDGGLTMAPAGTRGAAVGQPSATDGAMTVKVDLSGLGDIVARLETLLGGGKVGGKVPTPPSGADIPASDVAGSSFAAVRARGGAR